MSDEYCKIFCKGNSCVYENLPFTEKESQGRSSSTSSLIKSDNRIAVYPLLSSWITGNILAMQRPSQIHINGANLISKFKASGITAIVNLQMPKEHAHCFQGLYNGGDFSYDPTSFMNEGIQYFQFGWLDMTVPTFDLALRIVQVIHQVIKDGGKVAVHCHAGLGRTGLAIACYLLYARVSETADKAIDLVRQKRNGSIQNTAQVKFIKSFSANLDSINNMTESKCDLMTYLRNQDKILAGLERIRYKYVPKTLAVLTKRICTLERPIDLEDKTSDLGILNFLKVDMDEAPLDWSQDDCFRAILAFYRNHKLTLKNVSLDLSMGQFRQLTSESKVFICNLLFVFQPILAKSLIEIDDLMKKLESIINISKQTEYFIRSVLNLAVIIEIPDAPYFEIQAIQQPAGRPKWKSFAV